MRVNGLARPTASSNSGPQFRQIELGLRCGSCGDLGFAREEPVARWIAERAVARTRARAAAVGAGAVAALALATLTADLSGRASPAVARFLQLLQHGIEAHRVAGFDGFEQGDLDQDLLRGRIAQAHFGVRQHFQDAGQALGAGQLGLLRETPPLRLRIPPALQVAPRDLENQQVAEMVQQIGQQPAQVLAAAGQVVQLPQRRLRLRPPARPGASSSSWPCAVRPNIESTSASSILSPQKLMSWSSVDSASRMPPSAPRAMA